MPDWQSTQTPGFTQINCNTEHDGICSTNTESRIGPNTDDTLTQLVSIPAEYVTADVSV